MSQPRRPQSEVSVSIFVQSKPFWIMAKSVQDFVENEGEGCLPLCGSIPDMTAETEKYIALQQV
jgi:amyloid beta precursor protein binding protein 1